MLHKLKDARLSGSWDKGRRVLVACHGPLGTKYWLSDLEAVEDGANATSTTLTLLEDEGIIVARADTSTHRPTVALLRPLLVLRQRWREAGRGAGKEDDLEGKEQHVHGP